MLELKAKSPFTDLMPMTIGAVTAQEVDLGTLTSIMPFAGQEAAVAGVLDAAHGLALPDAGRATGKAGTRAIWFGRGAVLLAGPKPDAGLAKHAAISDQSDGWACVTLRGDSVEDVLARLVPVDLRAATFKQNHTARTMIQHMHGSVTRLGPDSFLIMVFRSMAGTLVHDLSEAMHTIAARPK